MCLLWKVDTRLLGVPHIPGCRGCGGGERTQCVATSVWRLCLSSGVAWYVPALLRVSEVKPTRTSASAQAETFYMKIAVGDRGVKCYYTALLDTVYIARSRTSFVLELEPSTSVPLQ